ncbi:endospore germination permease [Paenibacillus filicis]|uniref:Endospore germination permease n=1 Tax=Paenibacillus gyeongsangnamensis TaxID=3388067 RepID=A0ABT4QFJ8_9BACL|nr:endospore germination permease [Paenibacillus filicis]MCZ8515648.1 endospore germination permease [Paenibacillus filicis]
MIDKERITGFQIGMLMYPTLLATGILSVPSITAKHADRDLWLSPVWASLIGYTLVLAIFQLHRRYPRKTIIEVGELVLGSALGKLFGILFLFEQLHDTSFVLREYGEFVVGHFLTRTPTVVTMLCLIIVCSFALRGRVEVIARCAQIFVPLFAFFLLLIAVLLTPEYEFRNLLPVLEEGVHRSIRGSFTPMNWFCDFVYVSFLLPSISERDKGLKWSLVSVTMITLTMIVTNVSIMMLFGQATAGINYPVMVAARFISLADFVEHAEAILMAIWVMVIFIKVCIYYYASVLIVSQLFKLPDYRSVIFPVGLTLIPLSVWVSPNVQSMGYFFESIGVFYFLSVKFAMPVLLLAVAMARHPMRPSPMS